jgi:hypothetical protein
MTRARKNPRNKMKYSIDKWQAEGSVNDKWRATIPTFSQNDFQLPQNVSEAELNDPTELRAI